MNAITHSFIFWAGLTWLLLAIYILPTVIGALRHVENLGWLIVLNLLPTGIGWLAALIGALTLPTVPAKRSHRAPPPASRST